jgi:hypothetical protein
VRLGLALAAVRFVALATLRALPRLAEFPLGSFPRFCTFDRFLRLAMIDPPWLVFRNALIQPSKSEQPIKRGLSTWNYPQPVRIDLSSIAGARHAPVQ